MSKPSGRIVRREIRRLRQLIDNSRDPLCYRIAQGMEDALRWCVEDTQGWALPANNAAVLAAMLRKELAQ